jgi:hypothetical protein
MGKQVSPLQRAGTSTHLAAVQEFVRSSITALDEAQYETKNEFLGQTRADEVTVTSAAHSVDDEEQRRLQAIVQSGNSGFASRSQPTSAGSSARRSSIGGAASVAALADESSVMELLQNIKDDAADVNTVILGYNSQSSATLSLISSCMCRWDELPQHLRSDAILCVFHRSNKKNVVVNWLGASVAPLKRAKASTTFGSVVDIFSVNALHHSSYFAILSIFNTLLRSVSFPITASFMLKRKKTFKNIQ